MYTQEKSGFRVEETKYYYVPEMWDVDDKVEFYNFDTEHQVVEHIARKIAEKVAFYRHLDSKTSKDRSRNDYEEDIGSGLLG